MDARAASFPQDLRARCRWATLAGVPALLVHPDWDGGGPADKPASPRPACVWMHGRTVSKELDPGRYLRWARAGIAAIALDLPGHGERAEPDGGSIERTPGVIGQMASEIDGVLDALAASALGPWFDASRLAIGGMSAGGMATLVHLTQPRRSAFRACCLEATTGDLISLWLPDPDAGRAWPVRHDPALVRGLDPMTRLAAGAAVRPMPTLVLHSRADQMVPWAGQEAFVRRLNEAYERAGGRGLVDVVTWPSTGAPQEHVGFGRVSNDAKNRQTAFLAAHLDAVPPPDATHANAAPLA